MGTRGPRSPSTTPMFSLHTPKSCRPFSAPPPPPHSPNTRTHTHSRLAAHGPTAQAFDGGSRGLTLATRPTGFSQRADIATETSSAPSCRGLLLSPHSPPGSGRQLTPSGRFRAGSEFITALSSLQAPTGLAATRKLRETEAGVSLPGSEPGSRLRSEAAGSPVRALVPRRRGWRPCCRGACGDAGAALQPAVALARDRS